MKNFALPHVIVALLFFQFAFCQKQASSAGNSEIFYLSSSESQSWSLIITGESIGLTDKDLSISLPYIRPKYSSGVKIFRTSDKKHALDVYLYSTTCVDSVSGMESPYTVRIEARRKKKLLRQLTGCAVYSPDQRLNTVWRLESLMGQKVKKSDFGSELPYLDIHVKEGVFSGFAGCNRISGGLTLEDADGISFAEIIATKMMCLSGNRENDFLKALQEVSTYVISGQRLILFRNGHPQAVLVKVI